MKILIITPLESRRYKGERGNSLNWIMREWEKYKNIHSECSIDLEFDYKVGTDLADVGFYSYYYFCEKDIDVLKKDIESLIQSNEVGGLIIDPILTYKEEEFSRVSYIPGSTLEIIYNAFYDKLPIYYYGDGIGPFYNEKICEKINEDYREKGYSGVPKIASSACFLDYENMFNYFVDFIVKKQNTGVRLLKERKED